MSIREAANPFGKQPTDLLFLFYPPLFCEMTGNAPFRSPTDRGVFLPCGDVGICKKPFKVCSKMVHTFIRMVRYTMIVRRENTHPS